MTKGEIRRLVESTADPAFAVNGLHLIEFWNKAAEDFFGIKKKSAIGKSCSSIISGYDDCGKFCNHDCPILESTSKGKPVRNFDLRVRTSDGEKWCNFSILFSSESNSVDPYTIHVARSVDVSKRMEGVVRDFVLNETSLSPGQAKEIASSNRTPTRETSLSEREIETLSHLAQGKSTKEISKILFISTATVNNHVQHILKKLNAHSRLEAVRKAENAGLI